jgi:methyltransferase family protein
MDVQEIERRIAALPGWHYEFEFDGGVRTHVANPVLVNRQRERYRYFFDALLELTGGSLAGRRVLDLGCNAGFWSLAAAQAGADFVLGVDARQSYIDQSALVFEAKGIDPSRYRFERANIFELALAESFDVVLCLGLMSALCKPFELFELMSGAGAQLIVIDTEVSRERLSVFELARPYNTSDAVEYPLGLVPSRAAVVELASQFDFDTLALAPDISDYTGMSDYRRKRRLAFMCSKELSVRGLNEAATPSLVPWWVRDPGALLSAPH